MKTAFDVDAKMIVVLTESGTTARLIAKYRPSMPILALTAIPETARFTQGVVKNSYCVVIGSMIGTDSILFRALDIGRCVSCVCVCYCGVRPYNGSTLSDIRHCTASRDFKLQFSDDQPGLP